MASRALAVLAHLPHVVFTVLLMLWLDDVLGGIDFWAICVPLWFEGGLLCILFIVRLCKRNQSASDSTGADFIAMLLLAFPLLAFSILVVLEHKGTLNIDWLLIGIPIFVLAGLSLVAALIRPRRSKFVGMTLVTLPGAVFTALVTLHVDNRLPQSWFVIFVPVWAFFGVLLLLQCCIGCCIITSSPTKSRLPLYASASGAVILLHMLAIVPAFLFALFVCLRLENIITWQWARIFIPLFVLQALAAFSSMVSGPEPRNKDGAGPATGRSAYSAIQ